MCWKYKNKNGYVFLKCDIANNKVGGASYLGGFMDGIDGYFDDYNYCHYCGKKLEVKNF